MDSFQSFSPYLLAYLRNKKKGNKHLFQFTSIFSQSTWFQKNCSAGREAFQLDQLPARSASSLGCFSLLGALWEERWLLVFMLKDFLNGESVKMQWRNAGCCRADSWKRNLCSIGRTQLGGFCRGAEDCWARTSLDDCCGLRMAPLCQGLV